MFVFLSIVSFVYLLIRFDLVHSVQGNESFPAAEQALEILRVLPSLFPSTSAPPKRLQDASEALVHVLEVSCVAELFSQQYRKKIYN